MCEERWCLTCLQPSKALPIMHLVTHVPIFMFWVPLSCIFWVISLLASTFWSSYHKLKHFKDFWIVLFKSQPWKTKNKKNGDKRRMIEEPDPIQHSSPQLTRDLPSEVATFYWQIMTSNTHIDSSSLYFTCFCHCLFLSSGWLIFHFEVKAKKNY